MIPTSSWLILGLAALGAFMTVAALVRGDKLGYGSIPWFLAGALVSDLPLHFLGLSVIVAACFMLTDAFHHWPGTLALVVMAASWCGLVAAHRRIRPAQAVLEQALLAALGTDYLESSGHVTATAPAGRALEPFRLRSGPVEWIRNIPYPGGHERHALDVYRPAGGCSNAPVLLQIHGGGWMIGNKHEQALPLIYDLVPRGWIVVACNYRLSPQERFPAHLLDCKQAFAWVRRHIAEYGGDPSFIAVTGGSAGGHLTALMGLTANDPRLQPGFEDVDTTPAACVPFYGVYDFLDRYGTKPGGPKMIKWFEKNVMPCPPQQDPSLWDLASPVALVRPDAPPFFVLHGTHDTLAGVAEARLFVERLRSVSRQPVAYAELNGAQHAWEFLRTPRARYSSAAVARFLDWCRATRRRGA